MQSKFCAPNFPHCAEINAARTDGSKSEDNSQLSKFELYQRRTNRKGEKKKKNHAFLPSGTIVTFTETSADK